MLLTRITIVFLITINFGDSHVLKVRDSPSLARNLDITHMIDPVQQSRTEPGDDQPRRTKSVFSLPIRTSSVPDCADGFRRVHGENGPCVQEAPVIRTSGDKFLVDSLRKFYSPPSPSHRPHHRRRKPTTTTTTTTRRYDYGPIYNPEDPTNGGGNSVPGPFNEVTVPTTARAISSSMSSTTPADIIISTTTTSIVDTQGPPNSEPSISSTTPEEDSTTEIPETTVKMNDKDLVEITTGNTLISSTIKSDLIQPDLVSSDSATQESLPEPKPVDIPSDLDDSELEVPKSVRPEIVTNFTTPLPSTTELISHDEPKNTDSTIQNDDDIEATSLHSAILEDFQQAISGDSLLLANLELDPQELSTITTLPVWFQSQPQHIQPQRPQFSRPTLSPGSRMEFISPHNYNRKNIYQNDNFSFDYINMRSPRGMTGK